MLQKLVPLWTTTVLAVVGPTGVADPEAPEGVEELDELFAGVVPVCPVPVFGDPPAGLTEVGVVAGATLVGVAGATVAGAVAGTVAGAVAGVVAGVVTVGDVADDVVTS